MARYQQGIGIKDASEVTSTFNAPTLWQTPKAPAINRFNFTPANTGARRNYGSTPRYVDTVPSRWEHGAKGALINAATGFNTSIQKSNVARQRRQAAQQEAINNNPYSTSYESAVRQGQRAPQIAEAQKMQNVYEQAWKEYKSDPFMKAVREADPFSGEPVSTVKWRDEENPFPKGTFDPSSVAEPIENPFPAGSFTPPFKASITSAPRTRTQNRPLK